VGAQGQPYATEVQERQGGWVNLQAWALGNKKPGVLLLLHNTTQEHDQPQPAQEYGRKFIQTISHELFTPLNTIELHLENAVNGHNLTAAQHHEIAQKAWKEMERLMRLVANLKAWLHLELLPPLPRRRIKITDLAKEVADLLRPQAEARQITLEVVELERNLPLATVEVDAWQQLFVNLIDNGIKYGRQGGMVRIEARQNISGLSISIADDGPGIPPDEVSHLFEELFRGTSRGEIKGSGLGLYIVSQIVRQHSGQIHCESELGRGTTFYITLPL
jgi:signal transduction histidine kinase